LGTKRTEKRKYVFLYITCIVITAFELQGCTYFAKKLQDKQQDEQGLTMAKVPMDEGDNEEPSLKDIKEVLSLFPEFAKEWQGKQGIAEAKTLMFKGDFEASIKRNKDVLRQFPLTLGDQALFQMGLNYSHPEKANPDNQKAIECFQRVLDDYPKSNIRDEAETWILFLQKTIENEKKFEGLQSQEEDLKNQIEKHKKIYLQKTIKNNKRLEDLQSQKEDLKDQIEKLKKIDLGIEDKKRIDSSK
jgi:hypothetical protein